MLESLHVKNLALIDEAEVTFQKGLNLLTGETGAGKSIIIGSVNLALGAKADKEQIRTGAEYALIELVFSLSEEQKEQLKELDVFAEDDQLLLQRKIMPGRSVCRVNGETFGTGQLRQMATILLDMCGQHEHQKLLEKDNPAKLLDHYAEKALAEPLAGLKESYRNYCRLKKELSENQLDENSKKREQDLLTFEVNEIQAAGLVIGEDDALEKSYRRMNNARRILDSVGKVYAITGYEQENGAGEQIGQAVRELKQMASLDEEAEALCSQLSEIDDLLNDFNRSMADYQESLSFDEAEYVRMEERLNVLNHLKGKYGTDIEGVLALLAEKEERLRQLDDYDVYLATLQSSLKREEEQLIMRCAEVSEIRKNAAWTLSEKLTEALQDLNFLYVDFEISVTQQEGHYTEQGFDEIAFLISTNPGEGKRPLSQVASGGELSRIMLAFKSVLADEQGMATLVFDEIDAGISGKTAWKVSEKLGQLSKNHQILCITHLPQIAAMGDTHYLIEKQVKEERTVTEIRQLSENESIAELARLLGGGSITDAALQNAREMKVQANEVKKSRQ